MSGRKAYLDPVDEDYCLIPKDFPDFIQLHGVECYDYYKVNHWFNKGGLVFKLTWEECQDIIDAFDSHPNGIASKLSQQLLQYAINKEKVNEK